MKFFFKCMLIFFACNLFAKQRIQIVPVKPTPQSENVKIYIVYPEVNQMLEFDEVWVQIKLRGYPLGNITNVPRSKEIANSTLGQSIHVVVDNNLYFARINPNLAPYDEEGNYYEAMYKFKLPMKLSQGKHFLRIFPARSFGESLKADGNFAAINFFIQNSRINEKMNLSDPYITYNEPSGYFKLKEKDPILLDFYVSNCYLSSDGYKVKITIDNDIKKLISTWVPYYIFGLKKGHHTIRLQLLDKNMKQVPGFFNDITRKIYVN